MDIMLIATYLACVFNHYHGRYVTKISLPGQFLTTRKFLTCFLRRLWCDSYWIIFCLSFFRKKVWTVHQRREGIWTLGTGKYIKRIYTHGFELPLNTDRYLQWQAGIQNIQSVGNIIGACRFHILAAMPDESVNNDSCTVGNGYFTAKYGHRKVMMFK